jgi:hypothetical protein
MDEQKYQIKSRENSNFPKIYVFDNAKEQTNITFCSTPNILIPTHPYFSMPVMRRCCFETDSTLFPKYNFFSQAQSMGYSQVKLGSSFTTRSQIQFTLGKMQ